jgi:hypothetical protein
LLFRLDTGIEAPNLNVKGVAPSGPLWKAPLFVHYPRDAEVYDAQTFWLGRAIHPSLHPSTTTRYSTTTHTRTQAHPSAGLHLRLAPQIKKMGSSIMLQPPRMARRHNYSLCVPASTAPPTSSTTLSILLHSPSAAFSVLLAPGLRPPANAAHTNGAFSTA